tara:strand:- start:27 stop:887 length:861 start_codon:yes stop_codon:yes gene_type:complete
MKIIELVLDEEQEGSGIEAISIVESPAIEEDFIALKSDEIKLAEISKDKKLLMGALLVPNKPIYRKSDKEEYYIYFSKDTILKASQLYLKNGNQNNSTLEHQHQLSGLTLVESWIVESETQDKSRLYNLNVPVGTWMGTVKVNNDEVWNEYVKTNKVKGFSIEGYFADKMEDKKEPVEESFEIEAQELLSKIEKIVKGEKLNLSVVDDIRDLAQKGMKIESDLKSSLSSYSGLQRSGNGINKEIDKLIAAAKDLGVPIPNEIKGFTEMANRFISIGDAISKVLNKF